MSGVREMFLPVGKLLLKSYLLLLAMAGGGLVVANLVGIVAAVFLELTSDGRHAPNTESLVSWVHGGWLVGAGLTFVGAVLGA